MRQQVEVIVSLTYDADATLSREDLGQEIHDDVVRLLDADSASRVELVSFEIMTLREEAEIYGNL